MGTYWGAATYVVFGKTNSAPIDLLELEKNPDSGLGYAIHHPLPIRSSFYELGAPGDVNADGLSDVAIGLSDWGKRKARGAVYVMFGKKDSAPLNVRDPKRPGYMIMGACDGDHTGYSVDGAGDINGDGKDDLVIGSVGGDCRPANSYGQAHVVFGQSSTKGIGLGRLGDKGFHILGYQPSARLGEDVAGLGDVSGDGRPDVIVGAWAARVPGRGISGAAYVIFGKADGEPVAVKDLGSAGLTIVGAQEGDAAGHFVAGGDTNGDGIPDLMIGAPRAGENSEGVAYVVWGEPDAW